MHAQFKHTLTQDSNSIEKFSNSETGGKAEAKDW